MVEGYLAKLGQTRKNMIQAIILYHLEDALDGCDLSHLLISLVLVQSLYFKAVYLYCESVEVHTDLSRDH